MPTFRHCEAPTGLWQSPRQRLYSFSYSIYVRESMRIFRFPSKAVGSEWRKVGNWSTLPRRLPRRYAPRNDVRNVIKKGVRTFGSHRSPRTQTKKPLAKASGFSFGRGGWIRTNAMTESESVALPLGDAPIFKAFIFYQIYSLFSSVFTPFF